MKYPTLIDLVGNTPLVVIGKVGKARLWAKLEGCNPTGSIKDRTAATIIKNLVTEKPLLDASSGSFACALSCFAKATGRQATVVVNSKISDDNLAFLKIMDAEIIQFGNVTGESRQHCLDLIKKDPDKWFFTDQLTNPLSPKIHEQTTAVEILNDLPEVTAIIASKGSGATLCGITRHIKNTDSNIMIFGSVGILGDERKIAGTYVEGKDFVSPFIQELERSDCYTNDIPVTYREAMNSCTKLSVPVGPQGGGVYNAAIIAIKKHNIEGDVVLVMGDTILKNVSRFN